MRCQAYVLLLALVRSSTSFSYISPNAGSELASDQLAEDSLNITYNYVKDKIKRLQKREVKAVDDCEAFDLEKIAFQLSKKISTEIKASLKELFDKAKKCGTCDNKASTSAKISTITTDSAKKPEEVDPKGFHVVGNFKLQVDDDLFHTWDEADAYCKERSAHLAYFKDENEAKQINEFIKEHSKNSLWIGGTDKAKEGDWRWLDGSKVVLNSAISWYKGKWTEPTNSPKVNCLLLFNTDVHGLADAECDHTVPGKFPALCQKGLDSDESATQIEDKDLTPPIVFKLVDYYDLRWTDKDGHAYADVSFWFPKSPSYDYFPLGDVVSASHDRPTKKALIAKAMQVDALKPPTGFTEIWNDKGSRSSMDGRVLRMNAPRGYTCLGNVVMGSHEALPDVSKYRCVKSEYVTAGRLSSVWSDRGSKANKDFSAWDIVRGGDSYSHETGNFISSASHSQPSETPYLLRSEFAKNDLEVNIDYSKVLFKLYQVKEFDLQWQDTGARGYYDFSCWRMKPIEGVYRLSDVGINNYDKPRYGLLVKPNKTEDLKAPYDYRKIWGDHGSSAYMDGSFWEPLCPGGYIGLGYLCSKGFNKPAVNDMRCVKASLVSEGAWKWVWSDKGTSASDDCTVYEAVANDYGEQAIYGMGAIAKHGSMSTSAYVLQGDKTAVIDGKPVKKYKIKNVQYNIDDRKIVSSSVTELAETIIENRGDSPQKSSRSLTGTWSETRSWSHNVGLEIGVSICTEAKVPLIGSSSVTLEVSASYSYSTGGEYSEEKSDSVTAEAVVKAKHQKSVIMVGKRYKTDVPYTADITIEYQDGTVVHRNNVKGTYKGVNVAEVKVIYMEDIPLKTQ